MLTVSPNLALICPVGRYSNEYNSTTCTECSLGRYSSYLGSTSCEECPINFYSDHLNSSSCKSCLSGFYSAAGSTSLSDCKVQICDEFKFPQNSIRGFSILLTQDATWYQASRKCSALKNGENLAVVDLPEILQFIQKLEGYSDTGTMWIDGRRNPRDPENFYSFQSEVIPLQFSSWNSTAGYNEAHYLSISFGKIAKITSKLTLSFAVCQIFSTSCAKICPIGQFYNITT